MGGETNTQGIYSKRKLKEQQVNGTTGKYMYFGYYTSNLSLSCHIYIQNNPLEGQLQEGNENLVSSFFFSIY